jgi:hypothetical protein
LPAGVQYLHLALVEDENEVATVLDSIDVDPDKVKWIALSPFATTELEKRKIPCEIIEDYYDEDGLWNATGMETCDRVDRLVKLVDTNLRRNIKVIAERDIDVLRCYHFQLIMLFDGIAGRIFMLKSLISSLRPERVYVCRKKTPTIFRHDTPFLQDEQLWGAVLSLGGWDTEVTFVDMPEAEPVREPFSPVRSFKGFVAERPLLWNMAHVIKNIYLKIGLSLTLKNFLPSDRIFFLGPMFEWRYTVPLFIRRGFGVCYMETYNPPFERTSLSDLPLPEDDEEYRQLFQTDGVDYYPVMKDRIRQMLRQGISAALLDYKKIERYLKRKNVRALAASVLYTGAYWIIAQIASKQGIPVFIWPHGFDSPGRRKLAGEELLYTDYVFLNGLSRSAEYEAVQDEYSFRQVPIGSEMLYRLSVGSDVKDGHILYATTQYFLNNLYFSIKPPFLLSNNLFKIQKLLLEYLNSLKDERIVLKLFPSLRPPPLEISNPGISVIKNEKWFTELLAEAKLVILDYPVTNTLYETAATEKPLFLLNMLNPLEKEELDLLRKRAVVRSDPQELLAEVDRFIRTGSYPADVKNREFIKFNGTYLDDGKGTERAVDEVIKVIRP